MNQYLIDLNAGTASVYRNGILVRKLPATTALMHAPRWAQTEWQCDNSVVVVWRRTPRFGLRLLAVFGSDVQPFAPDLKGPGFCIYR